MDGGVNFRAMLTTAKQALTKKSPEDMERALSSFVSDFKNIIAAEAGPDTEVGIKDFIRQDFERLLVANGIASGTVAEIGGPHNSFASGMPGYNFEYLSLYREKGDPRVKGADITYCPQIPDNSFDAILSVSVMEHVSRPMEAAREMTRMLKPNGIVYHAAPFSYFYHGAPMDFWRYTPEAFKVMFSSLECLKSEFYSANRRRNNLGSAFNPVDRDGGAQFSPDAFGGWRENWFTMYAGRKSDKAQRELKARRTRQLMIDMVAMLTEHGLDEPAAVETARNLSAYISIDQLGDPKRRNKPGQPKMQVEHIRHLWRRKRRMNMLPTPNRYALGHILADLLPAAK